MKKFSVEKSEWWWRDDEMGKLERIYKFKWKESLRKVKGEMCNVWCFVLERKCICIWIIKI